VTNSRSAMSKQVSTGKKSKDYSKMTPEEQAKFEFDIMTQNLNLSPKEKAAKKKQEQEMKMKDKKMPKAMPKMKKGGMPKYQRGMMVGGRKEIREADAPESGPIRGLGVPRRKNPKGPAPYDDSGTGLGTGPKPPMGGPMPPKKKRAPTGRGRGRGSKMPMMKHGGKVRGCGIAKQGVRKAKMVTMKGS